MQKLPKQVDTNTKISENDIKTLLNKFILKNIFELQTECKIEKIDKKKGIKKYLIHTNYTCPECKEINVNFEIVKKVLEQKCKCDCRKHLLTDKIATKL